jgi:hypothetical protein
MPTTLVTDFDIAKFGFGFENNFDRPFKLRTPIGTLSFGSSIGLCGGMTFATLDYYAHSRPAPESISEELFDYLCARQTDSLDVPFGVMRYLSWQSAADNSTTMHGWRIRDGISHSTIAGEWPKIQALLDGGHLAPLGLVKSGSPSPKHLSKNHQVLAYGYDFNPDSQMLTIRVCDPNYLRDDGVTLRLGTGNPDVYRPVVHSREPDQPIRGFFLSHYVTPKAPPGG